MASSRNLMNPPDPHQGPGAGAGGPPPALVRAIARLAEPLVRLLLRFGVTLPMLVELLKGVYVTVAGQALDEPGKAATHSRISLLTGVHRKDVRRLRGQPTPAHAPPRSLSLGAQLVSRWMGERPWRDDKGAPRALAYRRSDGGDASFEALAESVSHKDLSARALLDELERLGIAHRDASGLVHLDVEGFAPRAGFDEQLYYFAAALHDHLSAAGENLVSTPPPHLERAAYFSELTGAEAAELEALAREQAKEALRRVNRRGIALKRRKRREGARGERIAFGLFVYRAAHDEAAEVGAVDAEGADSDA